MKPDVTALIDEMAQSDHVRVSPITAWEVGMLSSRGRLALSASVMAWFDLLLSLPGVALAELPPKVLVDATCLPGKRPRDPADCILAATAREYGLTLVTRDKALLNYGEAGHVNVVAC